MKKTINGKILKLICGAGNENVKQIEALAYTFSSAGFNMIDLSAKNDVIAAAKRGIALANKDNETLICVSVGLQNDVHLSKAIINKQKCTLCGQCVSVCPQNTIYEEDGKFLVDERNCIGCSKCILNCPSGAIISENKYKNPCNMLLSVLSDDIDCVEFHCSIDNENMILESWSQICSVYSGTVGFCLDRSKLSDDKLFEIVQKMLSVRQNVIFQTDGKPMSGGADDYKSNIQAIAFAELVKSKNLPVKVVVSGGTNSKTSEFAKLCNVDIDGVAIGSFARKLVQAEISSEDFFNNKQLQNIAIEKAKNLADNILKYLN
ncbi:4Fe-4S binding protein [bacterium]|nr:4Fe-4S binding protein [bacterium]